MLAFFLIQKSFLSSLLMVVDLLVFNLTKQKIKETKVRKSIKKISAWFLALC